MALTGLFWIESGTKAELTGLESVRYGVGETDLASARFR